MNIPPEADLALLHQQIADAIKAEFPDLQEVSFYQRVEDKIDTPAFVFELEEIEPGEENPHDRLEVVLHFSGYLVLSFTAPLAKLAARVKAANVASFIRGNKFGAPVTSAVVKTIEPDDFNSALGGLMENGAYEVMRIGWAHEAAIGKSVWDGEGETVSKVFVGFSPDIGVPNEPKYVQVSGADEVEPTVYVLSDEDGYVFTDEEGYKFSVL